MHGDVNGKSLSAPHMSVVHVEVQQRVDSACMCAL